VKIEPGRIMNDFIEPNKRQYIIPVYQRNYEWDREQCVKLFEDIVLAFRQDKANVKRFANWKEEVTLP